MALVVDSEKSEILEPMLGMISGVLNSRPRNGDLAAISSFQATEIEKAITAKRQHP